MRNVILRPYQEDDASRLALLANNENVSQHLRDIFPYPYTEQDAVYFLQHEALSFEGRGLMYAIDVDDQLAGSISVTLKRDVNRKTAELGYWLGEPYWGHGIMSALVVQVCENAFVTLDIVRIEALVHAPNIASKRVLERSGFRLEGTLRDSVYKHGVLMDTFVFGLLKSDFSTQHIEA